MTPLLLRLFTGLIVPVFTGVVLALTIKNFRSRGKPTAAHSRLQFGVSYGNLKLSPYWDPLRKAPGFDKLLAQLAPRD